MKTQQSKILWDTVKTVLRGKFIMICTYLKKQAISNKQSNPAPKEASRGKGPKLVKGKK